MRYVPQASILPRSRKLEHSLKIGWVSRITRGTSSQMHGLIMYSSRTKHTTKNRHVLKSTYTRIYSTEEVFFFFSLLLEIFFCCLLEKLLELRRNCSRFHNMCSSWTFPPVIVLLQLFRPYLKYHSVYVALPGGHFTHHRFLNANCCRLCCARRTYHSTRKADHTNVQWFLHDPNFTYAQHLDQNIMDTIRGALEDVCPYVGRLQAAMSTR